MSKPGILAWAIILLAPLAKPQSENFSKYRPIEAYEVAPGILMIPRYAEDGQVCEIGLEVRHYSPDLVRLDSGLPRKKIERIVDELVPLNERGPKDTVLAGRDMITETGNSLVTFSEYENVSIQIYSAILPTSKKHKIAADDVAAIIRWKNRKCR